MPDVRLVDITKRFGSTMANRDINLRITDGEFFTLLGPSGCGKSTMLRIIAGLETPDTGEVYIGDRLVNDIPPKDRNVAMVFQSYAIYPHMSVFDNVAFPLKLRKASKDEIRDKVMWALELLGIEELQDRKPSQLSGGQRQRVAVARALVRKPDVFLLDEPLSNLDALLRVRMRAELKRLQNRLGTTTIYVTHDQAEAMTMADRIAIMRTGGKIVQVGTPGQIYNHPTERFVASFVGSPPMNLIDGDLKEKNGKLYVDIGPSLIEIPDKLYSLIKEKASNSRVFFGVRPEDVIVSKEKLPRGFESEVYVAEPLGSVQLVNLSIGENIIKATTDPSLAIKMGEKVWVKFREKKIHIFDKQNEKLIF